MADDRRPVDPAAHRPEHEPRPGFDPVDPANDPAIERDPAATRTTSRTTVVDRGGGNSGMMVAAVIAVIAIIAAIVAMNWDWGSPQATTPGEPAAVEQETAPAPGDEPAATAPADTAPADEAAPADDTAPAGETAPVE